MEIRLGHFEEVILLLVGILGEESAYAFRIAQEYKAQTNHSASIGAVHSALERLEKKGLLQSRVGEPTQERGGRRKRIFTTTPAGIKVLKEGQEFRQSLWKQYPKVVHRLSITGHLIS